ncbi:MAG: amidase, partial [Maritimibacter sp.]|nr:amidase [Maritimibacter sp.]
MAEDWLWMSAGELGRGIDEGDIDPVALTDAYLDAIETHPLSARIYARLTPETARAQAAAAAMRARNGTRLGPLDGVPVSWKDLFDTAGTATEAGSALLKGRVPDHDADVVRNAHGMGLVGLGKTHMSELAFSGLGLN